MRLPRRGDRAEAPGGRGPSSIRNDEIAAVFEEIADLLDIEEANPFRIRAYRNAARVVRGLQRPIGEMLAAGEDLTELPGIGSDLAAKISDIAETGTTPMLDRLRSELLQLPGLGPKRVKILHQELGIADMSRLRQAAEEGRLQSLPGFGEKTVARLVRAIAERQQKKPRVSRASIALLAEDLLKHLRRAPGLKEAEIAGSYRRAAETVGDLDFLATARVSRPVIDHFVGYEAVTEVVARGPTRATVVLRGGLHADLRVVSERSFGSALHYFTGSKAHNIAVRLLGQRKGLKLNEYGVFRGNRRIAGETEDSVFRAVGLSFIPPELRENRGEIEAAAKRQLPQLIELGDLRGDLHAHTNATDGRSSLREMVEAAEARGFEYLAITDHSRHLTVARGLDPRRLRKQLDEIDRVGSRLSALKVLKGIEVDILADGRLDLPDACLAELDIVVGAVHSHFDLPPARQLDRIRRAMDNRYFTLLAHPSGRLLGQRAPAEIDMVSLIRAARERGCYMELNAQPDRLDLFDIYCQAAKAEGVLVSINSDAHATNEFDFLRFGVGQARRGWLSKADVLNTRPLADLLRLLARTR